jgi:hypothetical protein
MKNVITNIFDLPVKISILGALTSFTIKDMSEAGGLIVLGITIVYMVLKTIEQTRKNRISKIELRRLEKELKDDEKSE